MMGNYCWFENKWGLFHWIYIKGAGGTRIAG